MNKTNDNKRVNSRSSKTIEKSIVRLLSNGNVSLQFGNYTTEEDIELLRNKIKNTKIL